MTVAAGCPSIATGAALYLRRVKTGDSPMAPRHLSLPLTAFAAGSLFLPALVLLTAQAPAQERRVPSSAAEVRLSYAPVVQRAAPAVVNVYAARTIANRNPLLDDPFFRRFFQMPGVPSERVERSLGSGVLVDASGLVLTN